MQTIAIMCLGVLVGATIFPKGLKPLNSFLQTAATALLIFTMGVSLGSRPNFLSELAEIGLQSLALAAVPTVLSVAVVYPLSRKYLVKPEIPDNTQEVEK